MQKGIQFDGKYFFHLGRIDDKSGPGFKSAHYRTDNIIRRADIEFAQLSDDLYCIGRDANLFFGFTQGRPGDFFSRLRTSAGKADLSPVIDVVAAESKRKLPLLFVVGKEQHKNTAWLGIVGSVQLAVFPVIYRLRSHFKLGRLTRKLLG